MTDTVTDLTRGVYRRIYGGFIYGQRINKLSLEAEAWFWRLLVIVDDFGNAKADPSICYNLTVGERKKVKPRHVGKWLKEMEQAHLISVYRAKGEDFLHVEGFEENQPAGKNGKRLKRWPAMSEGESRLIQKNPDESSASDNDTDTKNDNEGKSSSFAALVHQVFEFWQSEMKHPKAQLTPERKKKIEERLEDSTVEEIQDAIRGCKRSDFHMGREPNKPQVFDDIQLICRTRSKLESFIALAPKANGGQPKQQESAEDKQRRESCLRCFGTGTEQTPRGARTCKHEELTNGGDAIVRAGGASVEGVSTNSAQRFS